MFRVIFICMLILFCASAYPQKKLTSYTCKEYSDARECRTPQCKNESNSQHSYKLNAQNTSVLMTSYYNGRQDSGMLSDCKIFDPLNWECKRIGGTTSEITMHDGIVTMQTYLSWRPSEMRVYSCEK